MSGRWWRLQSAEHVVARWLEPPASDPPGGGEEVACGAVGVVCGHEATVPRRASPTRPCLMSSSFCSLLSA
jgi:hypothetical protein